MQAQLADTQMSKIQYSSFSLIFPINLFLPNPSSTNVIYDGFSY